VTASPSRGSGTPNTAACLTAARAALREPAPRGAARHGARARARADLRDCRVGEKRGFHLGGEDLHGVGVGAVGWLGCGGRRDGH
jgi:hypothetical protein